MKTKKLVLELSIKKLVLRSPSLARLTTDEIKENACFKHIYSNEIECIKDKVTIEEPTVNKDDIEISFEKQEFKLFLVASFRSRLTLPKNFIASPSSA